MKHIYALAILMLAFTFSSQSQYHSLLDEAFSWKVTTSGLIDINSTQYFEGDTVIDGQTYKKLISVLDLLPDQPTVDAFVREDVDNEIVYLHFGGAENQLFDFDVMVGETVSTVQFSCVSTVTVESVGTISVGGTDRDMITMTSGEVWIEGVGSTFSLIGANYPDCIPDAPITCTCFLNNDVPEWAHPDQGSCTVITDVAEIESQISAFPNPAIDAITITGGQGEQYLVYNMNGALVAEGRLLGTTVLTTSELEAGVYLINIIGKSEPLRFTKL